MFIDIVDFSVLLMWNPLLHVVQGLLQSEIVQDGSNQVGFFGKCEKHADYCGSELDDEMEGLNSGSREVCARTEVSWT